MTHKSGPRLLPTGNALSLLLLISFLMCIGFGFVAPERFHMHQAWSPLLPGFEWLTLRGFVIGAVEAYLYGWYIAVIYVPLYRFFDRKSEAG
jgi:hypothetical protein